MSRRIACVGGGPGGLFLATLLKRQDPSAEVAVFERNQPEDAFGFGVVFSDATLKAIHEADSVLLDGLNDHGRHWDRIEVWLKGECHAFQGNGMAAIHRRVLLPLLQKSADDVGVQLNFGTNISDLSELQDYDVIVGADGANSFVRSSVIQDLGHSVETAEAKFIWFGTDYMFDGLTFVHRKSEYGHFAAHAYPISDSVSTFIVETDPDTWRKAGLDEFDVTQPPGVSDEKTRAFIEELFREDLDGGRIIANNSRWGSFRTRRSQRWHSGNVVLLGDAVHTAHFSVGSGTKMAMEDAIVLARELTAGHSTLEQAFSAYEAQRQPSVDRIQGSARGGLSWWERFGRYYDAFEPWQFTFHFFSRSINIDRIERRDPEFVARARREWQLRHGSAAVLDTPLRTASAQLPSRFLHYGGAPFNVEDLSAKGGLPVQLPAAAVASVAVGADSTLPESAEIAAVTGGDLLDRIRLSEELRLERGIPTILVGGDGENIDPETLVLSGRADAVALIEGAH
ncbi:FAD-dependent monooxygenase [Nesterenkonia alkaliphila]|uniref:2-polyprenyl-6-methoxyphenol hydroxylase n=1 Tax=Nesterenkonia alkaliphila TaxID=1463631 RepID=A0A7K1UFF7_9MICC|nr:FAD-dependent monooxygenase [Nesterenkonia alkaliphila]MVT25162.1 2-polyprenyl-6-methoxyphenol hydroxylase [Nesterenkonia alkaliphila]GFZ98365.1 hypothetical protein GCM10011359_29390 [Nesterenkonia alkaliphila]